MGMTDDFEASLQVLRGFDTDISVEVHEIKVIFDTCIYYSLFILNSNDAQAPSCANVLVLQGSVASSNRRNAIRFEDLKLRRYWLPLMVHYVF